MILKKLMWILFAVMGMYPCFGKTMITVRCDYLSSADTLELYHFRDIIGYEFLNPSDLIRAVKKDGTYTFEIDSVSPNSRVSLYLSYQKHKATPMFGILELYPIADSDDIAITMSPQKGVFIAYDGGWYDGGNPIVAENWACSFQSVGSLKYMLRQAAIKRVGRVEQENVQRAAMGPHSFLRAKKLYMEFDRLERGALNVMDSLLDRTDEYIDERDLAVLRADVVGNLGYARMTVLRDLVDFFERQGQLTDTATLDSLGKFTREYVENPILNELYKNEMLANSPMYIGFLTRYLNLNYRMRYKKMDLKGLYSYIDSLLVRYPRVRDRAVANMFAVRYNREPDGVFLDEVIASFGDQYSKEILEKKKSLNKGGQAKDFVLPDIFGNRHRLSDLKGKVVLIDFWYVGCIPCRNYINVVLKPVAKEFEGNDRVEFLLISIDKKEDLERALRSDPALKHMAIHLYTDNQRSRHEVIGDYAIVSYPFPILIDRSGIIRDSGSVLKTKEGLTARIKELLD